MMIWILVALPALVLGLTLFNLVFWPRGAVRASDKKVSVLIPARNEASNIETAVRAAFDNENVTEVVVYEDRSEDNTRAVLTKLEPEFPTLRVVDGVPLPDGWVGKPHACFQLGKHATQDDLLFLDADVSLTSDGVSRLLEISSRYDAPLVTAVPRQRVSSLFERLILPMLHVTYLAWLPLPLIWRSGDTRFLAANGQMILVTRDVYDDIGGFEQVKDAVVDDMAFCTEAKRRNHRVVFADGFEIASCRMYGSAQEVWKGFSKNIFEGIGSVLGLVFTVALYLATFVLPYVALVASIAVPEVFIPAVIAVAINVSLRTLLVIRFRHPVEGILFHPFAVLGLIAIAINSAKWHFNDEIVWAGRVYTKRSKR